MTWQDDEISGPMGYKHCILFDCARDAISAYLGITGEILGLPDNICPELVSHLRDRGHKIVFGEVNPLTGQTDGCVHLYGYQAPHSPDTACTLSVDPLMTGWVRQLKTPSAVISFGRKKMVSMGYGGAFLTDDDDLASFMQEKGRWNDDYTDALRNVLPKLKEFRLQRFEIADLWDRYLGDTLIKLHGEQLMPWRVMRRAYDRESRGEVVLALRASGFDVGTNYPPLQGRNYFGDTVLNFPTLANTPKAEIQEACEIIKRIVHPSYRIGIDG